MKRVLISIVGLIILAGSGYGIWQFSDQRAKAAKLEAEILKGLTAEEIRDVLESEAQADRLAIQALKDDAEKRKVFLRGLKETLALAAQARREGFADIENFKINLEYKKNLLLSDLYLGKLSEGKDKLYVVPESDLEAVWKDPSNEKLFERDMKVFREIRIADAKVRKSTIPIPELQGDMLSKARNNWARTKILSDKAKADPQFMKLPAIPLRLKIVEAGILSTDYLRANFEKNIEVSQQEIAAYIKAHPEYDVKKKLEKAETVLAKIKAGEDFEQLAKEYSEDRNTNENGGLYENIGTNIVWKEVEETALKLKAGEVANHLVETDFGYHIVKLISKNEPKKEDKSDLKFSVRHIVLQKKFEEKDSNIPGILPPYMKAEEIAKAEIEKEKRDKFVNKIIEQNPVLMPEDFTVVLPEVKKIEKKVSEKDITDDKRNSK